MGDDPGRLPFLQTQHLLDYSLLLGIHRPLESLPPQHKAAELQRLARVPRHRRRLQHRQKVRGPGLGRAASASHRPHGRARTQVYFLGSLTFSNATAVVAAADGATACTQSGSARPGLRTRIAGVSSSAQVRGRDALDVRMDLGQAPPLYADRFPTFVAHEVLHAEPRRRQRRLTSGGARVAGRAVQAVKAQWCGLDKVEPTAAAEWLARWKRLWERRRRGLVRERIDAGTTTTSRGYRSSKSMLGPSSMSWACRVACSTSSGHLGRAYIVNIFVRRR